MSGNSSYYEFVPYRFGAYSFQLKRDLEILQHDEFIEIKRKQGNTKIQAKGNYLLEDNIDIVPERGDALLRRACREHPYYAINSEILGRFFCGEELEQFINTKKTYTKTRQVLFTIGYEGRSIEKFINILIQNDIKLLCYVRKNPASRKFGFSKRKLDHIAHMVGFGYIHLPGLGIEFIEDYRHLSSNYRESLPCRKALLEEVYMLLCGNARIALVCHGREAEMFRRHVIRDYIVNGYAVEGKDV